MDKPINLADVCSDLHKMREQLDSMNAINPSFTTKPEVSARVDQLKKRLDALQQQLVSFDRYFKDTVTMRDNLEEVDHGREQVGRVIATAATGRKQ